MHIITGMARDIALNVLFGLKAKPREFCLHRAKENSSENVSVNLSSVSTELAISHEFSFIMLRASGIYD